MQYLRYIASNLNPSRAMFGPTLRSSIIIVIIIE